ncbi:hypothetical protein GCM10022226_61880 [Sphaerisporangium flaviroseum]|uniref:Methyltransferase n=1 Tax=Sphaerisporangium flaviroseum TaxID=509199 RepID=A0ABP7J220_9ACTN
MGKLTKQEAILHRRACELVELDRPLDEDEAEFVLEHWQESSTAANTLDGAFFTPLGLARDLAIEVVGDRIIDLCAGIGRLAWSCRDVGGRRANHQPPRELVCVERNPAYVQVGRKVLPEARWICADIFDLAGTELGQFDTAIGNPPFGVTSRTGDGPRYRGRRFEYHAIDIAADLARHGVFIVPQESAPFRYSGQRCNRWERGPEYERFEDQTGIRLRHNCGIDTSGYDDEWRGVSPRTEIVTCDFTGRLSKTSPPVALVGEQLTLLAPSGLPRAARRC